MSLGEYIGWASLAIVAPLMVGFYGHAAWQIAHDGWRLYGWIAG